MGHPVPVPGGRSQVTEVLVCCCMNVCVCVCVSMCVICGDLERSGL